MSDFEEVFVLLRNGQITEAEADELLADVDYSEVNKYVNQQSAIKDTQLVDDAHQYLGERYKTMRKAGLPASVAPYLDGMGAMPGSKGKVPMEYRWNTGKGGTLRIATDYSDKVNPLTGQKDINPALDPTDNSKPLTFFEGTQRQAQEFGPLAKDAGGVKTKGPEKATEYAQRQLQRRTGRKAYMKNTTNVTDTDFWYAGKDGKPVSIDGQITMPRGAGANPMYPDSGWRPGSQLYTWAEPDNFTPSPVGESAGWQRAKETTRRIKQTISDNPDSSFGEVMGILSDPENSQSLSGYGGKQDPFPGKIYDTERAPKDKTFWTEYSKSFADENKIAGDTISKAPSKIRIEDNKATREFIEGLRGDKLSDNIFSTPGSSSQVRVQFDQGPLAGSIIDNDEVIKDNPAIRQFMDYDQPEGASIVPGGQPTTKTFTKGFKPTAKKPAVDQVSPSRPAAGTVVKDPNGYAQRPGRIARTRSSAIPKGEQGYAALVLPGADEAAEGLKRNWKGGVAGTVLSGASREGAKKLAQGDVAGAAGEFATNYAIGAVGESALKKAAATNIGKRVIGAAAKRIPAAVSRFAGGTVASGGLAAPILGAMVVADVADGLTEGFTGKGIVTHGREAGERAEQRKSDLTAAGVSQTDQRRMFRRSTPPPRMPDVKPVAPAVTEPPLDTPVPAPGGPAAVQTETQRRRAARRSTGGVKKSVPGANAGQWWNRAMGALGNTFGL